MLRPLMCIAVLLLGLGCQQVEPGPSVRRLRVRAPAPSTALPALDRDTESRLTITTPLSFTLEVAGGSRARELKLHSPRGIELSVLGHSSRYNEETGWISIPLDVPLDSTSVVVKLAPRGPEGSVAEFELWGENIGSVAEEPPAAAPGSNLVVSTARYGEATLTPKGTLDGNSCSTFEFKHDVLTSDVRRVWLVLEVEGLSKVESLKVALNDAPLREGLWLDGAGVHTLREELDPRRLQGLSETLHVCLPDAATKTVTLREARLLLAVDDGAHWFDRDTSQRLPGVFDGDEKTGEAITRSAPPLSFDRPIRLERVGLSFESAAPRVDLDIGEESARTRVSFEAQTVLALKPVGGALTKTIRITAEGIARTGIPIATARELLLLGSPEGPRNQGHRLVVAHPQAQRLDSDGLHVGHYDGVALISGWATSESGNGNVTLEQANISSSAGEFSVVLRRPALQTESWRSTLRATFPDGVTKELTLIFDTDLKDTVGTSSVSTAPDSVLFGAENQTASALIGPSGGEVKLGERIGFTAPAGALSVPTTISITRALPEVVPRLDPGMVNVTAPANVGYRFGPKGQQFAVPVRVTLPYDARLLPEGMSVTEIETWFFDEATERWEKLPRKDILHATQQVVSETTHFTFMINAVLVTPEHAEPADFNPTSIKDLKAASPMEGLDLIELSDPGNQGTARLQLPIRLPKARGDYQPQLALTYDSSGGNGYLGVGWSLSTSSIALDTRFGVPTPGMERYLLDGAALVPTGETPSCRSGSGVRFARRVETDFATILHCDVGTANDRFEVTSKTGVVFVYGATADSRLQSYRDSSGAEWHLSEVIDRNGNVTRYSYSLDQRNSADVAAAREGENFRFLYPARVEFGSFLVDLRALGGPTAHRPDPTTSARYGFKTLLRRRLGSVVVRFGPKIVREYVLSYQAGDFGKSVLKQVQLYGEGGEAGGHLFNSHSFDYSSNSNSGFTSQEWTLVDPDGDRLSAGTEFSFGLQGSVGVGPTIDRSAGYVGIRLGYNHREQTTQATLVDVNGDRIPDRLTRQGVQLGDSTRSRFDTIAPLSDPASGTPVSWARPDQSLGREAGNAFNVAAQFQYAFLTGNLGASFTFSDSPEFLTDADGDGLVDSVGGNGVRFNQPRGVGACALDKLCFDATKLITTTTFENLDGGGLLGGDVSRADAGARARRAFTPNDALLEWIAPFGGVVDVAGALRYTRPQPAGPAPRDGVRLRVYSSNVRDGGTLADLPLPYGNTAGSALNITALSVDAGDHLYFRLSTGADLPVLAASGDAGPTPLEEVSFVPSIDYKCGSSSCPDITTPSGSKLYSSQLQTDFRLAGRPPLVVQAARNGKVTVTWNVNKPVMMDALRLCTILYGRGEVIGEKSCDEPGAVEHLSLPATTAAQPFSFSRELIVGQGQQLVFRAETRLPVDVQGVSAQVSGVMTEVCEADAGGCVQTTPQEQRYLRFEVDAQVPVHADSSVLLGKGANEGFEIPETGQLTVQSAFQLPLGVTQVCIAGIPCTPITFSVRTASRVLTSHTEGVSNSDSTVVNVVRGERLFVEAHSEVGQAPALEAAMIAWNVLATLRYPGSDGGVQTLELHNRQGWTRRRTYDRIVSLQDVVEGKVGQRVDATMLSGGHHGWFFGVWGGEAGEGFDLDLLEGKTEGYVAPELSADGGTRELRERAQDSESFEQRRARLLGVLLPKQQGTLVLTALPDGGVEAAQGLKPGVGAFVSTDSTAWVAADGTWHAGRKGGYLESGKSSTSVAASFDIGPVRRSSMAQSFSASIGAGPFSAAFSFGSTEQSLDMLDMNGDGIIDVVSRTGVQLTNRSSLRGAQPLQSSVPLLRTNEDLGVSFGLGVSAPLKKLSANGDDRGETAAVAANFGGGVGLNLGLSQGELMDLNGDGLPDMVSRQGNDIVLRLNLGGQFGAEDKYFVGNWAGGGGTADFLSSLSPPEVDSDDDAGVADRNAIASLLQKVATEEQLRRSVTASFNTNAGLMIQETYGVSANLETSLSGTEVSMLDVTGDGLPDYVRRSPASDGGVSTFLVKVNQGGSFAAERALTLPAWPANAGPNFVIPPPPLVPFTAEVQDVMKRFLGPGAESLLEANGAHTRFPGLGFTVNIPICPTGSPCIHIGFGADVSPQRVSGFEMGFQDIDGDGFVDHVLKTDAEENRQNSGTQSRIYVRKNQMGGGNLLRVVHRPLGGRINLDYVRTGNTVAMPESRWVLLRTTLDDGTGESAPGHRLTTQWAFSDGVFDRAEREFLGFTSVRSTTADRTSVTRTFDTSGFARKGLLLDQETRNRAGTLLGSVHYEYDAPLPPSFLAQSECTDSAPFFLDAESFCSRVFVALKSTESKQFERGLSKTARLTYEYDALGNVRHFVDEGDTATPDDDLNATVEYTRPDFPGLPTSMTVNAGTTVAGTLLQKRVGTFDAKGNLETLTSTIDATHVAETSFRWFANGNLKRVTSPPNKHGQQFWVEYEYDADTATWPTRTFDVFGSESTVTYAPEYGQSLTTTDVNRQTTTRTLDVFGRTKTVTGPREQGTGQPTIAIEYFGNLAVTGNLLPDGTGRTSRLKVSTFVDGLGRVRQTKTTAKVQGQGVGMTASGAEEFDALGRVVAQGQPVFTRGPAEQLALVRMRNPTRFTFDAQGRTTSTMEPNGALTLIDYAIEAPPGESLPRLVTQTTDARGKKLQTYRDTSGRVVALTENIASPTPRQPTTRYAYAPTGELLRVTDAAGNATSMTYDLLGRRLSLSNPDTGLHTSTYDAAGNVTTKVTPRLRALGRPIEYNYDFNRLVHIEYPLSEDVRYTYGGPGAPNGGVGRIIAVTDSVGVEKREYGPLGELTKQTRTVRPLRPGDRAQEFQLAFEWDSFGRALKVRYPDGELLQYQYDEGGLLTRAVGTRGSETEVYLADIGYDEFGQRVRAEYGNGVVTTYTHEPTTRRLETLKSNLSPVTGGLKFQDLKYSYDAVGNVESLTNRLDSPVSTPFGGRVEYTFGYDDLNRLTSATGRAASRPGVDDTFVAGWEYSDIHNLERATLVRQVTSMTGTERPPGETRDERYLYEAAHPHRARAIGALQLDYDDDGNTIRECEGATCAPGRARLFAWDEEGRMQEANAKGRLVRFLYDSGGRRMVKLAAGGPTFTFGQWFTMSGNSHATKHVFAGAGRVATKMIPAATTQANTQPGGVPGWPNTNGCIPSGDQPQKCPTNSNGTGWVERGVARPATWYYHSDSLGSTQWLTDDEGKLHERVEYYPYGELWRQSSGQGVNKLKQAFLYTGKEYDSETGLTYFGARYYDSRRARWLTVDPKFLEQGPAGLSPYHYVAWNPLRYTDPDGQKLEGISDYARVLFLGDFEESDFDDYNANPELHNAGFAAAFVGIGAAAAATGVGGARVVGQVTLRMAVRTGATTAGLETGADALQLAANGQSCVNGDAEACGAAAMNALDLVTAVNPIGEIASCAGGVCKNGLCFVAGTEVATEAGPVAIEKIRLGARVEAGHPECVDSHLSADAVTYRFVLRRSGASDDLIRVGMVRPLGWLRAQQWRDGMMWLEVAELELSGWAELVEVDLTPAEEPGAGCLVTMTVSQVAAEVLRVSLSDGTALELTTGHPLWVEGFGWLRARELVPGMLLRSDTQKVVQVLGVEQAAPNQQVFNIEVDEAHQYRVGPARIWSHNAGVCGGGNGSGSGAVRPGDVGTYGDLRNRRIASGQTEPLHMDHQPSFAAQRTAAEKALGRPLTSAESRALRNATPAIASPAQVHQQTSPTYGGRNTPARIANDAADLGAAQARDRAAFDEAMRKR